MDADKLVRMANQIAGFFRSYPDDEATAGIREHLTAFWTPRMCAGLAAHAATGEDGLDPLVRMALTSGLPGRNPLGPSPIDKETAGPARAGALGSDAG